MFKRINNHLLENYPQIWNLCLLSILSVLALFHLLHFVAGYLNYSDKANMGWREPAEMFFATSFTMFSIIGSIVIMILWLSRVFRNNAFKSFYPVSAMQLFGQFCVFFFVSLLSITSYYSFTYGYVVNARNNTNYEENERDVLVFNKVVGLLQNSKENYRLESRCYPAPFPLSKSYRAQIQNESGTNYNDTNYSYTSSNGEEYSVAQIRAMAGGYEFSYLNFCNDYSGIQPGQHQSDQGSNGFTVDKLAAHQSELLKNPEQLKASMKSFLELCDKHHIEYKIELDEWFKWVYHPPYFPVEYIVYQSYYNPHYDGNQDASDLENARQLNPKAYHVQLQKLQYILQNTQRAHNFGFEAGPVCGFIYAALAMAILIITFRNTSRRIWMISLVGSALLCLIVGAFTAVIGLAGGKDSVLYLYLLIIVAFLIVHLLSNNKTVSGVTLNWFTWSLPFAAMMIYALADREEKFGITYFYCSFFVYILVLGFALIPLYRRWMAMPEQ